MIGSNEPAPTPKQQYLEYQRFLGIELHPNNKDQRTHFMTKSQIDLSFPDIKQHVIIESSRNNAGSVNTITKPPLH